jgi:molybdopterin converting factor small subunit
MEILFFGQLTDITNTSSIQMKSAKDLNALKETLFEKYPMLRSAKHTIAVNNKLVNENITLDENSVIAFMSPYSGG